MKNQLVPQQPRPAWITQLKDADLAENISEGIGLIAETQHVLNERRALLDAMKDELRDRMLANDQKVLSHPDYSVKLKPKKERDVLLSVLIEGTNKLVAEGKLDPDVLQRGLFLTEPEPQWKTDFRYLPKIREFGIEAQEVYDAAVRETETFELVIEPKEKPVRNVTPTVHACEVNERIDTSDAA